MENTLRNQQSKTTAVHSKFSDYASPEEWLRWFRKAAGRFLTERVIEVLRADFEKETKKKCPET